MTWTNIPWPGFLKFLSIVALIVGACTLLAVQIALHFPTLESTVLWILQQILDGCTVVSLYCSGYLGMRTARAVTRINWQSDYDGDTMFDLLFFTSLCAGNLIYTFRKELVLDFDKSLSENVGSVARLVFNGVRALIAAFLVYKLVEWVIRRYSVGKVGASV
ncbi:hypothetical protein FB45DRAFT_944411 [Roridomyces roridus]|uniref:Uncharacterized protein n=1 Tax=Roridomyces roridus TaxID=1738132 RepID=A0AAD7B4A9_9AGAR|nr:hypothetical protein FB45DRAFT_944411 [Roridomyces roridus]